MLFFLLQPSTSICCTVKSQETRSCKKWMSNSLFSAKQPGFTEKVDSSPPQYEFCTKQTGRVVLYLNVIILKYSFSERLGVGAPGAKTSDTKTVELTFSMLMTQTEFQMSLCSVKVAGGFTKSVRGVSPSFVNRFLLVAALFPLHCFDCRENSSWWLQWACYALARCQPCLHFTDGLSQQFAWTNLSQLCG